MRALVTGGTGFLGRHLVPHLERQGCEVVSVNSKNCDLRDKENLLQFRNVMFDRIYHLAAWTKAGDFCLHHKGEQWIHNQLINTNLLWFWREFEAQATMIAMGTSCAYSPQMELREENYMVGEPDRDLYTYAMTKRMLYQGLVALQDQFGLQYRYLIPSTLFGPQFDLSDSHFIFDLIKKIVAGKEHSARVVLWGTGQQVRELIYVPDALRLIDLATEHCPNDLLNLGSGIGHSIREYAQMICEYVDFEPDRIEYDKSRYQGVPHKVLNPQKIHRLFDFQFTDVRHALAATVDYYLSLQRAKVMP